MANSILSPGDIIHVVTRRLFADDLRRHFAGTVKHASDHLVRAVGYTFVFNPNACEYRKRPELRTRIFSLIDAGNIFNILPLETNVDALEYKIINERLVVTDNGSTALDINEFGANY
ncbi:MAG: hypothetical protein R3229_18070 [Alphaproteobacteria bacterium]|nr:hypothetical protein [Alphaproteobacteria bacterium]